MATYKDLFIRSKVGDDGTIPRVGAQSASPDIIPWGTSPVQDPVATFTSTESYGTNPGKNPVANAQNYLYVRSKNLAAGAETGKVFLYYAQSSLLLYPDQWQNNIMVPSDWDPHKPVSEFTGTPVSAQNNGQIVVTGNPFTWQPQQPPSNWHYCLVARVATDKNPNPIPDTGDIQSFADWVARNGGIGWRNVSVTSTGEPTWTQMYAYQHGGKQATVHFFISCQNVPLNSVVQFSAGTPLPDGKTIGIDPTKVTNSTSFTAGQIATIPEGFETNIAYSYKTADPSKPPPKGFKIFMTAAIITQLDDPDTEHLYELSHTVDALGIGDSTTFILGENGHRSAAEALGESREIMVGQGYTDVRPG